MPVVDLRVGGYSFPFLKLQGIQQFLVFTNDKSCTFYGIALTTPSASITHAF